MWPVLFSVNHGSTDEEKALGPHLSGSNTYVVINFSEGVYGSGTSPVGVLLTGDFTVTSAGLSLNCIESSSRTLCSNDVYHPPTPLAGPSHSSFRCIVVHISPQLT